MGSDASSLNYKDTDGYVYKEVFGYNTIVCAILPKITGGLSAAGSAYIIQDVLRDPRKLKESTYHRLVLGLSSSDFLNSFFAYILSTWPIPKGYNTYAAGTLITCDAAGFISTLTHFTTPLYNCSLSTFFLIQFKYKWDDDEISTVEKNWLHTIPWLVGLTVAIPGLIMKSFGPLQFHCE